MSSHLGEAKLTDFGISKTLEEATITYCSTFVGTLSYMSPERMEGGAYNFSSDLWSVGVTVYEMVTGGHPYPDTSNPIVLFEMIRS